MRTLLSFCGALAFAAGVWLAPNLASAQDNDTPGECSTGFCGTPNQSGGGCGCGCGCSILIAMTDRGDTYQFADDFDGDGIEDEFDNCAFTSNFEQADVDSDGVGDSCDVCADTANPAQANQDGDEFGDACDLDIDGDGIDNALDNCDLVSNLAQIDTNSDGEGDVCDDDDDGDGLLDVDDLCRLAAGNTPGANCDDDVDGDGIPGSDDNCPSLYNPDLDLDGNQLDNDGDGLGDVCDADIDGDDVDNYADNCPNVMNPSQSDFDLDGLGDAGNWGTGLTESCDPSECYVIGGDASSCLDPDSAFSIQLALVMDELRDEVLVGDQITVAIFSNRLNLNQSWTADFDQMPRASGAILENAEGSGSSMEGFPQVANCLRQDDSGDCVETNQLRFTPDEPGTYDIRVAMTLATDDPQGLGSNTAVANIVAEVGGESSGGCTAGAPTGITLLALGLLGFVRRRRK